MSGPKVFCVNLSILEDECARCARQHIPPRLEKDEGVFWVSVSRPTRRIVALPKSDRWPFLWDDSDVVVETDETGALALIAGHARATALLIDRAREARGACAAALAAILSRYLEIVDNFPALRAFPPEALCVVLGQPYQGGFATSVEQIIRLIICLLTESGYDTLVRAVYFAGEAVRHSLEDNSSVFVESERGWALKGPNTEHWVHCQPLTLSDIDDDDDLWAYLPPGLLLVRRREK